MIKEPPTDRDKLAEYLESLDRESCYRVEATLKESPFETTQRVRFVGSNGSAGLPLIRKFIDCDSGLGAAYERIFDAQRSGQRFKHIPGIVECYQHDDRFVVVMEFVRGTTLQEAVCQNGPSLTLARTVFPRLCDAVTELHEDFSPPLIHRDLKPSNVILSDAGLTIIDFGIARDYQEGAEADTARFGTRAFAPPEQFGYGQTTVRSDVYALGVLLCYCLTESIPTAPLDDSLRNALISPAMRDVIARATAFDPKNRFASARALKDAFLAACGEEGVQNGGLQKPAFAPPEAENATYSRQAVSPSESEQLKTSTSGRIRNGLVLFTLTVFLAASLSAVVNPTGSTAQYPLWFNVLAYLVFMPLLFIGTAVLLADKTWFRNRIALVRHWSFGRWLGVYICLVIVVIAAIGIMGTFI